jgi:hypothetical protein
MSNFWILHPGWGSLKSANWNDDRRLFRWVYDGFESAYASGDRWMKTSTDRIRLSDFELSFKWTFHHMVIGDANEKTLFHG